MKKLLYDVQIKKDGKWSSYGKYLDPDTLIRALEYWLERDSFRIPELRAIPSFETVYHCE